MVKISYTQQASSSRGRYWLSQSLTSLGPVLWKYSYIMKCFTCIKSPLARMCLNAERYLFRESTIGYNRMIISSPPAWFNNLHINYQYHINTRIISYLSEANESIKPLKWSSVKWHPILIWEAQIIVNWDTYRWDLCNDHTITGQVERAK